MTDRLSWLRPALAKTLHGCVSDRIKTVRLVVNGEYDGPAVPYVRTKTFLPVSRCGVAEIEYYVDGELISVNLVAKHVITKDTVRV